MQPTRVKPSRTLSVGQSSDTDESVGPSGRHIPRKEAHVTASGPTSCLLLYHHCAASEQMIALLATGGWP
jgi:hypothetical protein